MFGSRTAPWIGDKKRPKPEESAVFVRAFSASAEPRETRNGSERKETVGERTRRVPREKRDEATGDERCDEEADNGAESELDRPIGVHNSGDG